MKNLMIRFYLTLTIAAGIISVQGQQAELPKAAVTYVVKDEMGEAVPDAQLRVGFMHSVGQKSVQDTVSALSDATGQFYAEGQSNGHIPADVSKAGYYPSYARVVDFVQRDALENRWQPWNPTVEVVLKRIGSPVAMYAKKVKTTLPQFGVPVGFDLQMADWVNPHGRGKVADFVFTCTRTVRTEDDFDSELRITFSNPSDGLQAINASHRIGSVLALPREAPENDYLPEWRHNVLLRPGGSYEVPAEDRNYFFRVRSTTVDGRLLKAWYGKIHGEIQWFPSGSDSGNLQFTYYLNPDSTRNMEFDPRENRFENLDVTERIVRP